MEWESFYETVKLLLPEAAADISITADQIELSIADHSIILPRQEFDSINSNCQNYTITPTCLFAPKEMEIIVDPIDSRSAMRLPSEPLIISDNTVSFSLFRPSPELLLSFLTSIPRNSIKNYRRMIPIRHLLQRHDFDENPNINFFDILRLAIRLSYSLRISINTTTSFESFKKYANAFLFNLAYNTGVVLKLMPDDISALSTSQGSSAHRQLLKAEEIETPKLFYNDELIEQYNLALSSNDAFIKFIAFYHIMEYFFDDVYDSSLISGVKEIVANPGFSTKKPKEIRKIIDFVQKKTRISKDAFQGTELEALELTIKSFVKIDELHDALQEYNSSLINYYRTQKVSFSEGDTIDLTDCKNEKLPKRIAARIYKTRNSMVHNKSNTTRLTDRSIYHPFKDDKELINEIPLMRIIAEQIILKTAKEI